MRAREGRKGEPERRVGPGRVPLHGRQHLAELPVELHRRTEHDDQPLEAGQAEAGTDHIEGADDLLRGPVPLWSRGLIRARGTVSAGGAVRAGQRRAHGRNLGHQGALVGREPGLRRAGFLRGEDSAHRVTTGPE